MGKLILRKQGRAFRFDNEKEALNYVIDAEKFSDMVAKAKSPGVIIRNSSKSLFTIDKSVILKCIVIQNKNKSFKICFEGPDKTIERLKIKDEIVFFTTRKDVLSAFVEDASKCASDKLNKGKKTVKKSVDKAKEFTSKVADDITKMAGDEKPTSLKGMKTIASELLEEINSMVDNLTDKDDDEEIVSFSVKIGKKKKVRSTINGLKDNLAESQTKIERLSRSIKNLFS